MMSEAFCFHKYVNAEEKCFITAITESYSISRTAINKHLHVLTNAGLKAYVETDNE
ncbi:hypothetical protein JCM16418_4081 [Paenibacillus pini JCM 16418]|uniref:Uncharacterized protein n=1 Tax=Paenibacillus pini JCM 16418 TaxID=1236976 RepID=W7YN77_9BACL|nr:hypothetical protein JCM16418_4081 [Paenibacillus pini JCM 16418]